MTPVPQSDGRVRPKSVWTLRSSARRPAAGGAWRSSTGAASSPVGTAIGSPMPVRARTRATVQQDAAERLRARLGWEPGILNGEGGKPKWMRWRTFERLAAEHDNFVGGSLAEMALRFGVKF